MDEQQTITAATIDELHGRVRDAFRNGWQYVGNFRDKDEAGIYRTVIVMRRPRQRMETKAPYTDKRRRRG